MYPSRPYHNIWYSGVQWITKTRVDYLYQYTQFLDALSLLVFCQHHSYEIYYWSQSRRQWRSLLHTMTHVPQTALCHLCLIPLYSKWRQITPTTSNSNQRCFLLFRHQYALQVALNFIVNGVPWRVTITLMQAECFCVWAMNSNTKYDSKALFV